MNVKSKGRGVLTFREDKTDENCGGVAQGNAKGGKDGLRSKCVTVGAVSSCWARKKCVVHNALFADCCRSKQSLKRLNDVINTQTTNLLVCWRYAPIRNGANMIK